MLKQIKYKDVKPIYFIDEFGNIYSKYKKDFMKPKKDKNGYLSITLSGFNKTIYVRIATLVIYSFVGKPPKIIQDPTVDHIDGNILNNHYTNLRWLERSVNSSIRKNRGKSSGELNHEAKLTKKQVLEISELLVEDKLSLKQIGDIYNVSKSTISNIKRKVNWIDTTRNYTFPKAIVKRDNAGKFIKVGSTGK